MREYYLEPILQPLSELSDPLPFQTGALGFETLRIHRRDKAIEFIHALDMDEDELSPFLNKPKMVDPKHPIQIMGIINVTPDSFSDGGQFIDEGNAITHAHKLIEQGADILDFGAESTRPNAEFVSEEDEISRIQPILDVLDTFNCKTSLDTRKAAPAALGLAHGVDIINDVSALNFDPNMVTEVAKSDAMLCLMHAQNDPKTMQDKPQYDHVLLDIYDHLEERIHFAENQGIARNRLIIDPGIGFGKTLEHNLALLKHIAIFHGLGCAVLVGASRKRMIETIGGGAADMRLGGSVAIALDLIRKGVHIIRVHDVLETNQAIKLQNAIQEATNGA